jgi:hypothetical protein
MLLSGSCSSPRKFFSAFIITPQGGAVIEPVVEKGAAAVMREQISRMTAASAGTDQ